MAEIKAEISAEIKPSWFEWLSPSLKAISHDKKSASVRQADVPTILTQFDPDKKSAVLQQKIG